ncbi:MULTISPECIES: hypothetical protein [unclassified Streptomyces]|uniref:hypothetical protein n=1 Tax=unclassified Streptomyces TaxID=2593676 RepID=UPI00380F7E4C
MVAHGLDPDQVRADLPSLTWLKLITRTHGSLVATDLGTAVHFHALYESSEERLSQVAQLVSAHQTRAPELARCVRRLAEGSLTFEEAAIRLRDSG